MTASATSFEWQASFVLLHVFFSMPPLKFLAERADCHIAASDTASDTASGTADDDTAAGQ